MAHHPLNKALSDALNIDVYDEGRRHMKQTINDLVKLFEPVVKFKKNVDLSFITIHWIEKVTNVFRELSEYWQLKYFPTREEKILIVHTILPFVGLSPMTYELEIEALRAMRRVLSKKMVPLIQVELDWKFFFQMLKASHLREKYETPVSSATLQYVHKAELVRFIWSARSYFKMQNPTMDKDIVSMLTPLLTAVKLGQRYKALALMHLFLPNKFEIFKDQTFERGVWQYEDMEAQVARWFDVWRKVQHCPPWDFRMFMLMNRLAETSTGKEILSPYIDELFSSVQRCLQLPIGGDTKSKPKQASWPKLFMSCCGSKKNINSSMASLLIKLLRPARLVSEEEQHTGKVNRNFSYLLRILKTYFHPNNTGSWSSKIGDFLRTLISEFAKRLGKEAAQAKKNDNISSCVRKSDLDNHLQFDDRRRFCELVFPLNNLCTFSKSRALLAIAPSNTATLCYICPGYMKSCLIDTETFIFALQSVNENHQAPSALSNLGALVRPMVRHAEEDTICHRLPLFLELSLPGIDSNDLMKTIKTLNFVGSVLAQQKWHRISEIQKLKVQKTARAKSMLKAIEPFMLSFMDRIFTLFANTTKISDSDYLSNTLVYVMEYFFAVTFENMSQPFARDIFDKFLQFSRNRNLLNAIESKSLISFVKHCAKATDGYAICQILSIVAPHFEKNASSSNLTLETDLAILAACCFESGSHVVKHEKRLDENN